MILIVMICKGIVMGTKRKNITNQIFGSLIAIEENHVGKHNQAYWKYRCVCGKEIVAAAASVAQRAKKALLENDTLVPACGCIQKIRVTKHGYRKHTKTSEEGTHPLYKIYRSMIDRCYNSNVPGYERYGGKGIQVCDEWRNSPTTFIEWSLANGWEKSLQIDKDIKSKQLGISPPIYSPETCQFVSRKVNSAFASNRNTYGNNKNIKLSWEMVDQIKALHNSGKYNKSELGEMFGVTGMGILYCLRQDRTESNDSV